MYLSSYVFMPSKYASLCLLLNLESFRIHSHSSQILYMQMTLLANIYLLLQNQSSWNFSHSQTCAEQRKTWVAWHAYFQLRSKGCSFFFQLSCVNKYPSRSLLTTTSLTLCWWFHSLKWSKHSADVLPNVPKWRRAVMCLVENIHVLG